MAHEHSLSCLRTIGKKLVCLEDRGNPTSRGKTADNLDSNPITKAARRDARLFRQEGGSLSTIGDWDSEAWAMYRGPGHGSPSAWEKYSRAFRAALRGGNPGKERHGARRGKGPEVHEELAGRAKKLLPRYMREEMKHYKAGEHGLPQARAIAFSKARRKAATGHTSPYRLRIVRTNLTEPGTREYDTIEEAHGAAERLISGDRYIADYPGKSKIVSIDILDLGHFLDFGEEKVVATHHAGPSRPSGPTAAFPARLRIPKEESYEVAAFLGAAGPSGWDWKTISVHPTKKEAIEAALREYREHDELRSVEVIRRRGKKAASIWRRQGKGTI